MSIPIDAVVPIKAQIGRECIRGTMLQLSDGSLYLISLPDSYLSYTEAVAMDRSYGGMLLKESIRQAMTEYNEVRRNYKNSKYAYKKTGSSDELGHMDIYDNRSNYLLNTLKEMRRGWRKFKNKSRRTIKFVDPDDAARKKEAALTAKRMKNENMIGVHLEYRVPPNWNAELRGID